MARMLPVVCALIVVVVAACWWLSSDGDIPTDQKTSSFTIEFTLQHGASRGSPGFTVTQNVTIEGDLREKTLDDVLRAIKQELDPRDTRDYGFSIDGQRIARDDARLRQIAFSHLQPNGGTTRLTVFKPRFPRGMYDIGEFGSHDDHLGRDLLTTRSGAHDHGGGGAPFPFSTTEAAVESIIEAHPRGDANATFTVIDATASGVSRDGLVTLRGFVEEEFMATGASSLDFKRNLTLAELNAILSAPDVEALQRAWGDEQPLDQIVLRRCSAVGKHINFHTDVSRRTMQLSVNGGGDDGAAEYSGGRLTFLSRGRVHQPPRPPGTIVIHDNTIVHGVSELQHGVRVGLFWLQH